MIPVIGTLVFAIDDRQRTIRGELVERVSCWGVVETDLGRYRRRRPFHMRFVWQDWPATRTR